MEKYFKYDCKIKYLCSGSIDISRFLAYIPEFFKNITASWIYLAININLN